jgi:hypothetical protein
VSVYYGDLMTNTATSSTPEKSMGLLSRIMGVFFSPRATYAEVAARPRWFGALAVSAIVIAAGFYVLLSTEVGQRAILDQQTQIIESFGVKLNDAAYDRMEQGVQRAKYTTPIAQLVFIPIVAVIIAGILLGIFNAVLGGDATFKQVLAIVAHSTLIGALQNTFSRPLDYIRETVSSPTSLSVLLPFIEEQSFLGRLTGMLDLFQVWSILSLAIGLGVLYKRRTAPIATTMFIIYFVIVAAIAAVRAALS